MQEQSLFNSTYTKALSWLRSGASHSQTNIERGRWRAQKQIPKPPGLSAQTKLGNFRRTSHRRIKMAPKLQPASLTRTSYLLPSLEVVDLDRKDLEGMPFWSWIMPPAFSQSQLSGQGLIPYRGSNVPPCHWIPVRNINHSLIPHDITCDCDMTDICEPQSNHIVSHNFCLCCCIKNRNTHHAQKKVNVAESACRVRF